MSLNNKDILDKFQNPSDQIKGFISSGIDSRFITELNS
jgi:hypothetical protein